MHIYARQGDLVFRKEAVSGELTKAVNHVLAGAKTAPHTLRGTALVRTDGSRTHFRIAEPTTVEHAGRHKAVTLEPGDYLTTILRERGGAGDREVED